MERNWSEQYRGFLILWDCVGDYTVTESNGLVIKRHVTSMDSAKKFIDSFIEAEEAKEAETDGPCDGAEENTWWIPNEVR